MGQFSRIEIDVPLEITGSGVLEMTNPGRSFEVEFGKIVNGTGHEIRLGGGTTLLERDEGLTNNGILRLTGTEQVYVGSLNLANNGSIIAEGSGEHRIYTGPAVFTNRGTLHAKGSGGITIGSSRASSFETASNKVIVDDGSSLTKEEGDYNQSDGSTTVNGVLTLEDGVLNLSGGSLGGSGTVNADVSNTGGTVGPGNSPGILSVLGDYAQTAGASLLVEIGGLVAGTQFDVLDVSGVATLAGLLDLQLIDGFLGSIAAGDEFTFMNYSSLVGGFGSFSVNGVSGLDIGTTGLYFDIEYGDTSVKLTVEEKKVAGVPDGGSTVFLLLVSLGALAGWRRGRR
ncbi:hypothetical protein VDG1235_2222 [Verrucomicrobiia bacterium DG1235]|nr:hypothetical protein VDG1235_2222 [Verrucomicrobiae bacterium DG1235]